MKSSIWQPRARQGLPGDARFGSSPERTSRTFSALRQLSGTPFPGATKLIAQATLRESAEGSGFELRCPPEYEAQIVDYASPYAVLVDFGKFHCPIKVVGADPTLPYSYLPTLDLSDILSVDYDFLPDATHFLPLEMPEECATIVREFVEQVTTD